MFCCRQLSHYSQRVHSIPLLMCAPFCLLSASCLKKLLAFMPEHISGLRREVVPVQTAVCSRLEGDTLISFALFHALAAKQCFVTFLMHPKLGKDCCGPDVSVCNSVRAVNILCAGMYSMRGRSKKQQLHFFYCTLLKVQSNYFFPAEFKNTHKLSCFSPLWAFLSSSCFALNFHIWVWCR